MTTYRDRFTAYEWATLQFAPLWVFTMVAAIDGNVETREIAALAKELAEAPLFRNPLAREVFLSIRNDFQRTWDAFQRDTRSATDGLSQVRQILESKVDPETAEGFRRAVIFIGHKIVESASRGIFGRKKRTEEKTALVLAAIILGVQPE